MKKINLLYLIGELTNLILITLIAFMVTISLLVIVSIEETIRILKEGVDSGFRRSTS
jgi:hypothetical protein|tara:strand:+ start:285 stop:455 length:171 start_codon:yes stop_codon:yes gene_type:complete